MPSKCSMILMKQKTSQLNITFAIGAPENVIKRLPSVATSILIVVDNYILPDVPSFPIPVIVIRRQSLMVHYRCALSDKFTVMTFTQLSLSRHSEKCSLYESKLTVGYNQLSPYFTLSSSGTLPPPPTFASGTLEGELLRTFISHKNLNVSFRDAKMTWGSFNKTIGKWNGLVGMVSIFWLRKRNKLSAKFFIIK